MGAPDPYACGPFRRKVSTRVRKTVCSTGRDLKKSSDVEAKASTSPVSSHDMPSSLSPPVVDAPD
jgi:hypothetical protein